MGLAPPSKVTMYKEQNILCVIPARGGSKRLPGKNIKPLLGRPLIAYAIAAAKGSTYVDRVVVTTDDEAIAAVARECGAEIVMRPAQMASDEAPVIQGYQHAVQQAESAGTTYDLLVLIQPTVPGVRAGDVDAAIEKIIEAGTNCAITVAEISERPEFMFRQDQGGVLAPYAAGSLLRTQDLETLYRINGAVYVTKRATVMDAGTITDQASCAGVVMPRERSVDIDTALDFMMAETLLREFDL